MSSSNCCFLTCIQISQEAGKVVCYSHLFINFPQFVVIHTVKGFSVVNETEVAVFMEFSCFWGDPMDVGNLISGSSAFSKSSCTRNVQWSRNVQCTLRWRKNRESNSIQLLNNISTILSSSLIKMLDCKEAQNSPKCTP